jgi:phage tail sheath protein FI
LKNLPNEDAERQTIGSVRKRYGGDQYASLSITGVCTSVAAFIGSAKSGPFNEAVLIGSFREFEEIFGGFITKPRQYLAYAVDMFFKNGGRSAYIVRVEEGVLSTEASSKASGILSRSNIEQTSGKLPIVSVAIENKVMKIDYDTAFSALEKVDNVGIVAVPGVYGADIYKRSIMHCSKMGYRFVILDPPPGCDVEQFKSIRSTEMISEHGMAATYYPWLRIIDPVTNEIISVPPSGAVAGVYARVDETCGVHKAPANESLAYVTGLEVNITSQQQEVLIYANINSIRFFTGKGSLVWGARTISNDPTWRHISVRRLLFYLEKSIRDSTQQIITMPNDGKLWAGVITAIEEFLMQCWKNGMLMGKKPEEGFFIKCGLGMTMTSDDILNGILIMDIGVAPERANEFVLIRITYFMKE